MVKASHPAFLAQAVAAVHLLLAQLVKILEQAQAVLAVHPHSAAHPSPMQAAAAVVLIPQHHPVEQAVVEILALHLLETELLEQLIWAAAVAAVLVVVLVAMAAPAALALLSSS